MTQMHFANSGPVWRTSISSCTLSGSHQHLLHIWQSVHTCLFCSFAQFATTGWTTNSAHLFVLHSVVANCAKLQRETTCSFQLTKLFTAGSCAWCPLVASLTIRCEVAGKCIVASGASAVRIFRTHGRGRIVQQVPVSCHQTGLIQVCCNAVAVKL